MKNDNDYKIQVSFKFTLELQKQAMTMLQISHNSTFVHLDCDFFLLVLLKQNIFLHERQQ